MERKAIPRAVRRQVRARARDRCEYCQHPASYACAPFVCEHILPHVHGSGHTLPELAWACPACNVSQTRQNPRPRPADGAHGSAFSPAPPALDPALRMERGLSGHHRTHCDGQSDGRGATTEPPRIAQLASGAPHNRRAPTRNIASYEGPLSRRRPRVIKNCLKR